MKKTKRQEEASRLKRMKVRCQVRGMAPALKYDDIGRAVCGKNHSKKQK